MDCMNWDYLFSALVNFLPGILWDLELLLRIFVALILGMLIGNERKHRMKSAGMRTHALVALGAALVMVVSKYGFEDTAQGDGARLASQVVSGVGFLGAGMIFVRHNLVSGLTTAAGIWTTAGIGLTIGAGMYFVGICSALMLVAMQNLSHRIPAFFTVASNGLIRMTVRSRSGIVEELEERLRKEKIDILSVQINKTEKEKIRLEFDVKYPIKLDKTALLCSLAENSDVFSIGE